MTICDLCGGVLPRSAIPIKLETYFRREDLYEVCGECRDKLEAKLGKLRTDAAKKVDQDFAKWIDDVVLSYRRRREKKK